MKKIRFFLIFILLLVITFDVKASNDYQELKIPDNNGAYFNNLEFPIENVADLFYFKV